MNQKPESQSVSKLWREDIIYMILIDRFHRGKKSADQPVHPFHGGNISGVMEKLDYLQDLGITAIWLSPVYKNQQDGYHGYWPVDFYAVDPRFGTMEELVELVKECHHRGLKVLLDKIFNHAGYDHSMPRDPKYKGWFHTEWDIRWVDQKKMEMGSLHGLPDFAHEKPAVSRYLIDMALWWVDKTGVDGFRLDAVKHVPIFFWKQFSEEIHRRAGSDFLLLGEVFRGIPHYLARYQNGGIESVFDVPFSDTIRSALTHDCEIPGPGFFQRINELGKEYKTMLYNEILRKLFARKSNDMRWFSNLLKADTTYSSPDLLAPIIDNHDLARFISEAKGSEERLKMALTMLLTWRGIPVMTYGTECGMGGRTDGSNRAPMAFGSNPELYAFAKKLIEIRKSNPALTEGNMIELFSDREVFAYLRESNQSNMLMIVNNSCNSQKRTLKMPESMPRNSSWTDLIGKNRYQTEEDELHIKINPRSSLILSADA